MLKGIEENKKQLSSKDKEIADLNVYCFLNYLESFKRILIKLIIVWWSNEINVIENRWIGGESCGTCSRTSAI